jgi:protein-L-isoaspartate(D-aspartate) O-methyltransferase
VAPEPNTGAHVARRRARHDECIDSHHGHIRRSIAQQTRRAVDADEVAGGAGMAVAQARDRRCCAREELTMSVSRQTMVERHLRARGITDAAVLAAMSAVPREAFLPPELAEFAYEDQPLPIAAGQTISQPYIVALMAAALRLKPGDRVLEIGAGSGYAAAVLAQIAATVYTVERHAELATAAQQRLRDLGYANVEVRCGDGTLGWAEHAPYQAIVVAAGGPSIPDALLEQLAVGGRLVIPVGPERLQELARVVRVAEDEYRREDLGPVRFVPLIGRQGWAEPAPAPLHPTVFPRRNPVPLRSARSTSRAHTVSRLIAECVEPIERIEEVALGPLLDRIGDARVVLLGEATHGTSEFYRMRTRITQELILRRGFTAVAVEADWPDAAAADRFVRDLPARPRRWVPFQRFPTWMWRNRETQELLAWLREYNQRVGAVESRVSFSGLDLYSLYTSAYEVVRYLDRVDPATAAVARHRYGTLTPWQADPAAYGRAVITGRMRSCEDEVVTMLEDLLRRRLEYAAQDGDEFLDAAQNARVVAGAERYYRTMYYGATASWNMRDQHMFDTLENVLAHRGPDARIVVWEHNSHIGDAAATEMATRGEHNVGHLCRTRFGTDAFAIGFGTDHGLVAAAADWDEPMQRMRVRAAHADSYERLFHDAGVQAALLHLREPARDAIRDELMEPRLERAIGVVYRPDTELESHYFQAVLPAQFDEYVWFDATTAVDSLPPVGVEDVPESHPFAR